MNDRFFESDPKTEQDSPLSLLSLVSEGGRKHTQISPVASEEALWGQFSGHERSKLEKESAQFDALNTDIEKRERFYSALTGIATASDSYVSQEDRLKISAQIVRHAASPETVRQGHHQTCSATTAEYLLYKHDPAAVAQFTGDLVSSRQYSWKDMNITSTVPASIFKADEESRSKSGRDLSSQIFQMGMINVYWHGQNSGPFGLVHGPGAVRFEEVKPTSEPGDTGERLILHNESGDKVIARNPEVQAGAVQYMYMFATRDIPPNFVIENVKENTGVTLTVSDVHSLRAVISERTSAKQPLAIKIHAGNEPFLSQLLGYNSLTLDSVWHVLAVDDFNAKHNMVKIHDPARHEDNEQWISLDDLYRATTTPRSQAWKTTLTKLKH
jgi:hypothetical protein